MSDKSQLAIEYKVFPISHFETDKLGWVKMDLIPSILFSLLGAKVKTEWEGNPKIFTHEYKMPKRNKTVRYIPEFSEQPAALVRRLMSCDTIKAY